MRVAISCDHAGFLLKQTALDVVQEMGHLALDLGTDSADIAVDYPDFAERVGRAIQMGEVDRAILICGSGVGATVAANKMNGVYACLCHDTYSAHQGVEHDQINVLCLGGRIIGVELAKEIIRSFLNAEPSSEKRHLRRVGKVRKIESDQQNG
ncbi:MAG: ribose 5-phosphate isomerase B [Anaerolineaceae bacterium]